MRIQSVSINSFMNSSQYYAGMNASDGDTTTATQTDSTKASYSHYDILDISSIDLGDDNTLDEGDIEAALQTKQSQMKRDIRVKMRALSTQPAKISNIGFDNHFLKNSPNEFITQAAKIFAAYLNPEMSGDDGKVFAYAGDDFETAFNEYVKDVSHKYAGELSDFFSSQGQGSGDNQVDGLVDQITQAIKEYGTQLATGKDVGVDNLTTKLSINGVEMTIGQINATVATINDINPGGKVSLDTHADFAAAGLGVAKMKAFSYNTFSKPIADMLMKTYNDKVNEEINKNDTNLEQSKKVSKKNDFLERYLNGDKPKIESKDTKKPSDDPYYSLDARFIGSAKEEIFNTFSKIDVSSVEKSKEDYLKAEVDFKVMMHTWESKRGYALSFMETRRNDLKLSAAYENLDSYVNIKNSKDV